MSYVLKYKIVFTCLILVFSQAGIAQLNILSKKLDKAILLSAPSVGDYTLQDPMYRDFLQLRNGYPDEKAAWIVYSDRSNNTTYQNPGSENQPLASLSFMQACFVIGEKGDYLELVEYVPGVNMSKNRKIISSPKYLGWVNKNALLLWNRALKDKMTNHFFKAVTAFGSERVFTILPQHVSGDSMLTFSDPFLNRQQGTCAMESLFYLYKESSDGNEYLIGPNPDFLPEQAGKAGLAWVSKDMIRVWGTKGYITLEPTLEGHIPFYAYKQNRLSEDVSGTTPIATATAPSDQPKTSLSRVFPILRYRTSGEGKALISTGLLTDVMDKGNNRIYNLAGESLSYDDIQKFSNQSASLNIILVVAGGVKNRQYINNLYHVIESGSWRNRAGTYFNSVNIGAVVYNDYGTHCRPALTPLTADLDEIGEFLLTQKREKIAGCDNGNYYQAVYEGISEATKMLRNHKDESNIILLYGSGTDESGQIGRAIAGITATHARLLVFQTHNIPNERAYVDFVGHAKDLISKSARNIIELKKRFLVSNTYTNVVNGQVEYTMGTDTTGRVMFLDYPEKSVTQGYILFPNNGENMPPHYLAGYLDSLITCMGQDNRRVDNALHVAMAQNGTGNTRINRAFDSYFPEYAGKRLPAAFLKANTMRNQKFLLPVWTSLSGNSLQAVQTALSSGVLLSQKEFTGFISALTALGGEGTYLTKDMVVKQILRAVERAQKDQVKITKPLRELTFTEAMGFVTGYFPMDAAWVQTTMNAYLNSESIPSALGIAFLKECRNKAAWLRDQYNNPRLQYHSNGNVYYLIKSPNLPISPVFSGNGESELSVGVPPNNRGASLTESVPQDSGRQLSGTEPDASSENQVVDAVPSAKSGKAKEEALSSRSDRVAGQAATTGELPQIDIEKISAELNILSSAASEEHAENPKNPKNANQQVEPVKTEEHNAAAGSQVEPTTEQAQSSAAGAGKKPESATTAEEEPGVARTGKPIKGAEANEVKIAKPERKSTTEAKNTGSQGNPAPEQSRDVPAAVTEPDQENRNKIEHPSKPTSPEPASNQQDNQERNRQQPEDVPRRKEVDFRADLQQISAPEEQNAGSPVSKRTSSKPEIKKASPEDQSGISEVQEDLKAADNRMSGTENRRKPKSDKSKKETEATDNAGTDIHSIRNALEGIPAQDQEEKESR